MDNPLLKTLANRASLISSVQSTDDIGAMVKIRQKSIYQYFNASTGKALSSVAGVSTSLSKSNREIKTGGEQTGISLGGYTF